VPVFWAKFGASRGKLAVKVEQPTHTEIRGARGLEELASHE